jgi:exodeoxyribonuclease VII large subunit
LEVLGGVRQTYIWLVRQGADAVAERQMDWEALRNRLQRSAPVRQIDIAHQRLDSSEERLRRTVEQSLRQRIERLAFCAARLESLNPSSVLSRGYSIVQRADGEVVTTPEQTSSGERLLVRAAGGQYAVLREQE